MLNVNEGQMVAEERVNSALGSITPQKGSKKKDKISALPGQPSGVNFDQYSGYVTVDADAGRVLFYYFTELTQDRTNKSLVLWMNGGNIYTHKLTYIHCVIKNFYTHDTF